MKNNLKNPQTKENKVKACVKTQVPRMLIRLYHNVIKFTGLIS